MFTGQITTTIAFPAGAVSRPVTVTLALTDTGTISSTLREVGAAFVVTARAANGQPVTRFLQPVTIMVQYSDADVVGIEEDKLKIFYWDVINNVWIPLPTIVDPAANMMIASLNHLTKFGVLGPTQWLYLPVSARFATATGFP